MEPESSTAALASTAQLYRLSRHLQLRPSVGGFIVESLITGHRELLPNLATLRVFLSLTAPQTFREVLGKLPPSVAVERFLSRCVDGGLLTEIDCNGGASEDETRSLEHWEAHDLAFHLRSRRGRNEGPIGATWWLADTLPVEPARRASNANVLCRVPLPRVNLDSLIDDDISLSRALERRRSRYSVAPVSLEALAALLFRSCRVTEVLDEEGQSGGLIRKVHPSGGSLHSLEIYVVANRCVGLEGGGYRYDAFSHALEFLRAADADTTELLHDAKQATMELTDLPSVLLIFASRFRRVTRKYQSISYHVILQEVGALYQTIYLVAESVGLGVSALGSGDSDLFARVFATDFFAESSLGEMIVGGRTAS